MIIHSIELEGFGRFLEPARFTLSPDRPNLITGPNGAGKSTLLGALSAAFVISHRSNGEDIRRWQPWGRELSPRVTVEFESGGRRYRLTKTYLQQEQALLEEEGPQGFAPLARGVAVEERLPAFLGGAVRQGVDARTRRWLLAGLLWVPQNRLLQTEVGAELQDSIRGAFGALTRSPALQRILAEVKRLYGQDWTELGAEKRNSPLRTLPPEIEGLKAEISGLQARLHELNSIRDTLGELQKDLGAQEAERSNLNQQIAELERQAQERKEIEARRKTAELEKQKTEAEYGRLKGILDARATLEIRRRKAQERRVERAASLARAESDLKAAEQALEEARERCRRQLADLPQQAEQLRAPAPEALRRLEELAAKKAELTAKLESALLHAEIIPEADGRLEVLEGEPRGWVELRGHETARISGSPRIELRIPGFGRLRLTGPAESAAALRDRLDEAGREWARLTEPYGGAPLEELRERRRKAEALALELDRTKDALAAHDRGASPEAVARDAARQHLEIARSLLDETLREVSSLEDEARQLQGETRTDAEIQQEMSRLALAAHGLEGSTRESQQQLSAFPPDLDRRLEQARRSVESLDARLEETRRQYQQARDRLNQLQGQEIYSALAAREALLEQKQAELARERLRAGANRLLKQTLEDVLDKAQQQVLPRVAQNALEILREITEGFAEGLALKPNSWSPWLVRPAAAGQDVDPDQISGGEQEQLHLAVRLALADVLTEREPFPAVLDDALLSTDDARLGRVLQLLEERRNRIQWLILTCHPERFAALENAHRITLAAGSATA